MLYVVFKPFRIGELEYLVDRRDRHHRSVFSLFRQIRRFRLLSRSLLRAALLIPFPVAVPPSVRVGGTAASFEKIVTSTCKSPENVV